MKEGTTKLTITINAKFKEDLKILGIRKSLSMGELISEACKSKWFSDTGDCTDATDLS
jgi:hypothetical protein